ncbi:hypothetical protein, partial [Oleiphilus sp. HI0123]
MHKPIHKGLTFLSTLAITSPVLAAVSVEDTESSTMLLKLMASAGLAALFGTLCFILFRLNARLKNNVKSHEATEQLMSKLSSAVTNSGSSIV